ncbi:MAG: DUF2384 domain-containing protein [Thiohalomonadales bacterium]
MNTEVNQKRINFTTKVMEILQSWGLTASQQSDLLAMPGEVRSRHMRQYIEGTPFPEDVQIDVRADHIVGISDALRTSYPRNVEMGPFWMKRSNKLFAHRSPIICILEDGLSGLLSVRTHLDCAYGWHLDDLQSKTKKD